MEPVVTPEEMNQIDREAVEPVEILIDRAGWAVAGAARRLLGRTYGARVLVIAGKGNNGADGRVAAHYLERAGCRCRVVAPGEVATVDPQFDLVIDAAFGTGFRGDYEWPDVGSAPVLAVDIPSGVDGLTGDVSGEVPEATATITFAAPKPGLLLHPGRGRAGEVTVADLGLDCSRARSHHLSPADVALEWPRPGPTAHKWQRAVWVIGGSPGMSGAPALAAAGAARGGAGYVTASIPGDSSAASTDEGGSAGSSFRIEVVQQAIGGGDWSEAVVGGHDRFGALVVGPGLATDDANLRAVAEVAAATGDRGLVLDGGALDAVVARPDSLADRAVPAVLTPHDGELARLLGHAPGPDRLTDVRALAARLHAVVLAKGPTTTVAHPDGRVLLSTAGDQRLATAGTGDVLAGLVGAGLAGGLDPFAAAGLAAELHGGAARSGWGSGFVAGDLPALVAATLHRLQGGTGDTEHQW